ncbi:carboxylating nicotinate-nucleotide diphosphorylase [Spirochaeta isovalerica]|uniref:Probable nicotinate-nucleotide pyrophosphorylase [carboxylating] n=1 Tax=Spirochaeta isovalerica TaxID=150 RepID=A0A841R1Y2_9SPIO|nr:carboxylating nicotinate-nucleotide diphosphorylase [Spirochaeta isovalerica]MBB6479024.1 nicotinate-nucleotide pyrophosphorylase (carboxylating) [Spirochaeta isovalerica]
MKDKYFEKILELALEEDLKEVGDVTSRAIFADDMTTAVLYSKDSGILAGIDFFRQVFIKVDPSLSVTIFKKDGSLLKPGDKVAEISGLTAAVLEAERTAINFLSFLSGIATETDLCVAAAKENGGAVVLDTRKTLPGYRSLSKYAVSVGGGTNHRFGLYDMVMIKDNHIDASGSITAAVGKVRDKWDGAFEIEVECRNLQEVREAVSLGVDRIMLDNMDPNETAQAVALGDGTVSFEASGNMHIEKIKKYSPTGVHFISVGSLTHSVGAFDFTLKIG